MEARANPNLLSVPFARCAILNRTGNGFPPRGTQTHSQDTLGTKGEEGQWTQDTGCSSGSTWRNSLDVSSHRKTELVSFGAFIDSGNTLTVFISVASASRSDSRFPGRLSPTNTVQLASIHTLTRAVSISFYMFSSELPHYFLPGCFAAVVRFSSLSRATRLLL